MLANQSPGLPPRCPGKGSLTLRLAMTHTYGGNLYQDKSYSELFSRKLQALGETLLGGKTDRYLGE